MRSRRLYSDVHVLCMSTCKYYQCLFFFLFKNNVIPFFFINQLIYDYFYSIYSLLNFEVVGECPLQMRYSFSISLLYYIVITLLFFYLLALSLLLLIVVLVVVVIFYCFLILSLFLFYFFAVVSCLSIIMLIAFNRVP